MHFNLRFCFLFLLFLLAACSTQAVKPANVDIEVEEPNRIRFEGKGAGAGMMLSSSMGPMGIAIGVAIDEGIGKDIDKAAVESGFDITQLLKSRFSLAENNLGITVKRYGFKLTKSEEGVDWVVPTLELEVLNNHSVTSVSYPLSDSRTLPLIALEEAKTQGTLSISAFTTAIDQIFLYLQDLN